MMVCAALLLVVSVLQMLAKACTMLLRAQLIISRVSRAAPRPAVTPQHVLVADGASLTPSHKQAPSLPVLLSQSGPMSQAP